MKRPNGMSFEDYRKKLKESALKLKDKLAGRFFKLGNVYRQPVSNFSDRITTDSYRKKRKNKNKMARKSRRINRLRAA